MPKNSARSLNDGTVVIGRGSRNGAVKQPKTLIISGLARSGTSMVARTLHKANVFLGETIDDIVYEDKEISDCLNVQDLVTLQQAIRIRNARFRTWGFKKPNIHDFINPEHKSFFRNPYYIFTFRDPIAIAARNILSESFDEALSLEEFVSMQRLMLEFILKLRAPVLLISYEKAIQAPSTCVEAIVEFAGLHVDPFQKHDMVESIEPNRREYLAHARRFFDGCLDHVRGNVLIGWCRQVSLLEPIAVNIFINDDRVATIVADAYREDLAIAGVGAGEHAFCFDMAQFEPKPSDVVRIFAEGRSFELRNSGLTIHELRDL